jgi:hypothetical protein
VIKPLIIGVSTYKYKGGSSVVNYKVLSIKRTKLIIRAYIIIGKIGS